MLEPAKINVLTNFNDFNLTKELCSAIADMGFVEPSEIQQKAIPLLLQGKDIIGQAATGTGKTAAFAIPCIASLDAESDTTQALILCPTRELVVQVTGELQKLTKYQKDISVLAIYGGQDISIQLRALKKGANIVVGTPGRIMDHLQRRTLKLDQISYLVLDEADQMLDMGFEEDMENILSKTPKERQTVMFSATMSKTLMTLMEQFQKSPQHINTVGKTEQSKQIKQLYFHINGASKVEALKRLLSFYKVNSALIFCNTKIKVDELAKELTSIKYSTAGLHGDMDQKRRDKVMQEFRRGGIQLLIATDVAARGLDVNDLEAVINFDLPRFDQDYVHRIGRTGRAGKVGLALSFVVGKELEHINRIARKNNMTIDASKVPEIKDFEESNFAIVKSLVKSTKFKEKHLEKYAALLEELELTDCSPEDIAPLLLKTLLDQESKSLGQDISFEPERFASGRSNRSSRSEGGGGQSSRSRPRNSNRKSFGHKSKSARSSSSSSSAASSGGGAYKSKFKERSSSNRSSGSSNKGSSRRGA